MRKYRVGMLASLVITLAASQSSANAHTPRRVVGSRAAMGLPHNRIYNGTDTHTCAWPSTVLVLLPDAICTGTLVHPDIVVYAAHCGIDVESVLFGEDVRAPVFGVGGEPARVARADYCNVYPGHDPLNGTDFAYCKLREPVTDVPVVPILMGCEQAALRAGKEVVMVGFGQDQDDNVAIKEEVRSLEGAPASLKVYVGGDGNDTCFGDSGGPVFVQLTTADNLAGTADNAWRVFALTSYGLTSACGGGSFDSLTYLGVPWIEEDSGVDITPCFDAYGQWDPGPACGQFPTNPGQGGAVWATGCSGAPTQLTGAGATCGAPYDPVSPILTFTAPGGRRGIGAAETLAVTLRATDAVGGLLREVHAAVDGVALQDGEHAPPAYRFAPVTLPPGSHTLTATGVDAQGRTATSRLTVLVSDDDAHGNAGCAASSAGAWAVGLGGLWVGLRRRRTLVTLAVLALWVLPACGSPGPEHVSYSVVTGGAEPRDVMPATWSQAPRPFAEMTGAHAALRLESITRAVYGYGFDENGDAPTLLVVLSDQTDVCAMLQKGGARPFAQTVIMEFTHTDIVDEDQPTAGTYAVPPDAPDDRAPGRYVMAACSRQGPRCEPTVAEEAAYAADGTVQISTTITHAGAYVFGTITGLRFGPDDNSLDGRFVAEHCHMGSLGHASACH